MSVATPSISIGATVSHYLVLEKIGEGGMGAVYRAEDTRLGRHVALKFLHDSEGGEEALDRFQREARAASALNNPHICTLHDIGEHAGCQFMVMELLEGLPLNVRIAGHPLPAQQVATFGMQIADALEAAHRKGIIHRDIKPANIFITTREQVKVLDFGMAKLQGSVGSSAMTENVGDAVAVVGTLPYMAPEQLLGQTVDGRTDIYALGAVLYEMTTGQMPFKEPMPSRLVNDILHQSPVAPCALKQDVPAELERIILKCLEKDPENRYQSAKEVEVDLRRLVLGSSEVARVSAQPRKWRTAVAVGLAGVMVAALAWFVAKAGRGHFFGIPSPTQHIESVAVLPLANLSGEAAQDYFADGMTDELIARLAKIAALRVISRTSVMRYKASSKSLPEIARELRVDAVVEGTVLRASNRVRINIELVRGADDRHLWAETYERDLRDVLTLQSEVASAIVREIRIKVAPQEQTQIASAPPVAPEAYEAYLRGRSARDRLTPESLKEAENYFRHAIEKDPGYALAYAGLAETYVQLQGRALPAPDAMPKAKTAAMRALKLNDALGESHASLAEVKLFYDFDVAGAGAEFRRALELSSGDAWVHQMYGLYLASQRRWDESLAESNRALQLDPVSSAAGCIRARVLYYARQYDQAIAQYSKTLDLDPKFAGSCTWLSFAYDQTSRSSEAIAAAQRSSDSSPSETLPLAALAHACTLAGRKDDARRVVRSMQELSKHRFVSPHDMAVAYIGLDNDQAVHWLEEAYRGRSGLLIFVGVDPVFDELCPDPRFQSLMRRLGLGAR